MSQAAATSQTTAIRAPVLTYTGDPFLVFTSNIFAILGLRSMYFALSAILKKFHALLEPSGILCIADLDKEDGSFHTDGTTDVHLGFERGELQKWVEDAVFADVKFSTAYEIKKKIDNAEKIFPVFLLTAQRA
jgi:hypothetical protein